MDLRFHPSLLVSAWTLWCSELGRLCVASSPSLVSVVVSGRVASSFRLVLGLSSFGAESQLFKELHVLRGNAPLVLYSMLQFSGQSA
jgi:hypothetical protein